MSKHPFNLEAERSELLSPLGFQFFEQDDPEEIAKNGNLCRGARSRLMSAVRGIVIGLDVPAWTQVEVAHKWLERSVRVNEPGTYAGGRGGILETYGLAQWLLTGDPAIETFRASLEEHVKEVEQRKASADALTMDTLAPLCVHAHAYEDAASLKALFEQQHPAGLTRDTPRAAGFFIAEGLRGVEQDKGLFTDYGVKVLKKHAQGWFDKGHYLTALSWLKIVHWDLEGRALAPADVVKTALRYLN